MRIVHAAGALLLDIRHLAVRRDLPVLSGHAPAAECREADQSNETHHDDPPDPLMAEQLPYRSVRRANIQIRSEICGPRMESPPVFGGLLDSITLNWIRRSTARETGTV